MSRSLLYVAPLLLGLATAQSVDDTPEVHPKITTYKCTTDGGCVAQNSAIVLESTQHTIAQRDDSALNCGARGTAPNTTVCPDVATCQDNCVLTGMSDYTAKGVRTNGSDLNLLMLDPDTGSSYSPRIYLLNEAEDEYEMLKLTGQEFTFDVDMSKLPCGMNSALYLSEMPADGGASMNPDVTVAGAKYGTGYCDAQCYVTTFVNGVVSAPPPRADLSETASNHHHRETSMAQASAAVRWTSGRPTAAPINWLPIPATRQASTSVMSPLESVMPTASVTRTAARRTPTRSATPSTTALT